MDGNPLQECDHGAILLSVMRYRLGEKKKHGGGMGRKKIDASGIISF